MQRPLSVRFLIVSLSSLGRLLSFSSPSFRVRGLAMALCASCAQPLLVFSLFFFRLAFEERTEL
jgi:Na+(H+)/acetate symporter ActP